MTGPILIIAGLVVCIWLVERWLMRCERRDRALAKEDAIWHSEALLRADKEGRILQAEPDFRSRKAKLEWRRQHWPLP